MPERRVRAKLKEAVAERAGHCCEYCRSQARFSVQPFSIEHVIPRSQGGDATEGNLALACQGCNNHKCITTAGPDPVSGLSAPLYHPRRQRWRDHFAWSDDFALIIGLTSTGRATVETLQLNRQGIVNLRRILYAVGEHPPSGMQPEE